MLLSIDLSSDTPIYQQIRDQVVVAIASGQLAEGSQLPTTRQLASDFGINFHTVNKAYELLHQEGFVRLTRKNGTRVYRANQPDDRFTAGWSERLRTLLAEAYIKDMPPAEILTHCQRALATFSPPQFAEPPAEKGLARCFFTT